MQLHIHIIILQVPTWPRFSNSYQLISDGEKALNNTQYLVGVEGKCSTYLLCANHGNVIFGNIFVYKPFRSQQIKFCGFVNLCSSEGEKILYCYICALVKQLVCKYLTCIDGVFSLLRLFLTMRKFYYFTEKNIILCRKIPQVPVKYNYT